MTAFDLSGYTAEAPKDGGFETFKYDGPCQVNHARVVQSTEASEFYKTPVGTDLWECELEVLQGEFAKRKLWKRFNLGSEVASTGKVPKTPVQKLADQLFTLDLEFKNVEELNVCNSKLVDMTVMVKAYGTKLPGREEKSQLFNFKGVAPDKWDEEEIEPQKAVQF